MIKAKTLVAVERERERERERELHFIQHGNHLLGYTQVIL